LELVDVDQVIESISQVITRWNSMYIYDRKTYNCQLFVDEILASLGIDVIQEYKGQLGEFLKKLRNKGECNIEYQIPHEIQESCQFKEKKIQFKSHQELDKFVQTVEQNVPKFEMDYPHDFKLLKSFDRAFWLRHYRSSNRKEFIPVYKTINSKEYCDCPFKDPVSTNSLGGDEWFEIDDTVKEDWGKKTKVN
jgi:hypothetical protein